MRQTLALAVLGCAMLCAAARVQADTTITVSTDPTGWLGFANVFELPANGGGFVFGSVWGVPDLIAEFASPTLTLRPNSVNDTSDFWYQGGGGPGAAGNKVFEANLYKEETGTLNGQTVTFNGYVHSNTLVSPYTSVAFIKDFAPDYSSNVTIAVPLTPGPFSVSLATINDPARHVQFGFQTVGPVVWITDNASKGSVVIGAVPEPATVALLSLGALGAIGCVRRTRGIV